MNLRRKITEIMAMQIPDINGEPTYIPITITVPLKHERRFGCVEIRIDVHRGIIVNNNMYMLPDTYQYDVLDQEVAMVEGPMKREKCGYVSKYNYVLHLNDGYLDGKAGELKRPYTTNREAYDDMVRDCERQLIDMHLSEEDFELVKKHMEEGPYKTMLNDIDDPSQTTEAYAKKAETVKKYFRQAVSSILE